MSPSNTALGPKRSGRKHVADSSQLQQCRKIHFGSYMLYPIFGTDSSCVQKVGVEICEFAYRGAFSRRVGYNRLEM